MKIAIVIEKFHPGAGGNERSTEQIARRLIQRGHEVTILTNRAPDDPPPLPGGKVLGKRGLSTATSLGLRRFVGWAKKRLISGGYDASISMTTAVPAMILQPRGGTVRETLRQNVMMRRSGLRRAVKRIQIAASLKQRALLHYERRTMHDPSVRRIVAISHYVMDQLFTHYEIRSRQMELIPNAAEIADLDPASRAALRHQMRSTLMLADRDVVFLFAAMNPHLKGLGHLLEALAKLLPHQPEARLIIAGTHRYSLLDQAEKLGVRDQIRWVGPTRQMDALYAACDVTVLPTWYDPASKVVLESLLHGIPAITTQYNGSGQWILDPSGRWRPPSPLRAEQHEPPPKSIRRAGRVVDSPADIAGMTQAMAELCDADERRACSAATAGLSALISMDRHVDDLERLLKQVAAEK